jgi:hypothetical protein
LLAGEGKRREVGGGGKSGSREAIMVRIVLIIFSGAELGTISI